jgi:hypothetical protein
METVGNGTTMPDAALTTPVLDLLWTAMDALLDAADRVPAGSHLERRVEVAIRQCALALIPAKEAALLERFGADRAVA